MPLPRLVVLIAGVALILGMMLWLVNALYRLYIQISFTAPLLANILLFLLILLLAALVGAFVYYLYLITNPKPVNRTRQSPKVPAEKAEAAESNLKAIRQQVEQIQDKVARQELSIRREVFSRECRCRETRFGVLARRSPNRERRQPTERQLYLRTGRKFNRLPGAECTLPVACAPRSIDVY